MSTPEIEKDKGGRPLIYESPEELQKDVDAYMAYCEVQGKPKTMTGLANALGMDRRSLVEYAHRDKYSAIIKRARAEVQQYLEEQLVSGKNASGLIFNLKNNFGWTDERKIEQNITGGISLSALFEKSKQTKLVQNESSLLSEPQQSPQVAITEDFISNGVLVSDDEDNET